VAHRDAATGLDDTGDPFSPMGSGMLDFSVYEKALLGWIRPQPHVSTTGRYSLAPPTIKTSLPQALLIKNAEETWWIEYRSRPFPRTPRATRLPQRLEHCSFVHECQWRPIGSSCDPVGYVNPLRGFQNAGFGDCGSAVALLFPFHARANTKSGWAAQPIGRRLMRASVVWVATGCLSGSMVRRGSTVRVRQRA
jgi:hypothetical protein